LLCLEPYKHPKTTKLNFNTIKEERNGIALFTGTPPQKKTMARYRAIIFFLDTRKKATITLFVPISPNKKMMMPCHHLLLL
jgi:hypothetical protein